MVVTARTTHGDAEKSLAQHVDLIGDALGFVGADVNRRMCALA